MKTKVRGFVFITVQRILAHAERFSDTLVIQGDIKMFLNNLSRKKEIILKVFKTFF